MVWMLLDGYRRHVFPLKGCGGERHGNDFAFPRSPHSDRERLLMNETSALYTSLSSYDTIMAGTTTAKCTVHHQIL
jgi:hypothetical protein